MTNQNLNIFKQFSLHLIFLRIIQLILTCQSLHNLILCNCSNQTHELQLNFQYLDEATLEVIYFRHGKSCDIYLSISGFIIEYLSASPPHMEPVLANKVIKQEN